MFKRGQIVQNIILGVTICLLASCVNGHTNESVKIDRFESDILQFDKLPDGSKSAFIDKYRDVLSILNFSVRADTIADLPGLIPATPVYKSFSADVEKRFVSLDTIAHDLAVLKTSYETMFPGTVFPGIKTFITPFNQSVIVTDTTLLIGLNHYLGANHPMYGYYEEYQRVNKEPSRIVYDVSEALVRSKFDNGYTGNENTLLSHMLYEGFVLYAVRAMLDSQDKDNVTGYSHEQSEWSFQNESNIWNKMIGDDLLYSKSGVIHSKIIQAAPFVPVISMDCPGRIGCWIGLRIIESYVRNNKDKNMQLIYNDLKTKKSQTIFMESRYDGK